MKNFVKLSFALALLIATATQVFAGTNCDTWGYRRCLAACDGMHENCVYFGGGPGGTGNPGNFQCAQEWDVCLTRCETSGMCMPFIARPVTPPDTAVADPGV